MVKVCSSPTPYLSLPNTDFVLEYADPETDGGLEQDLASRRYRALLPEEEYDSDDY